MLLFSFSFIYDIILIEESMIMRLHIGSRSSNSSYEVYQYMKPDTVYIPLENKDGIKYKSLVRDGDYVYKGQKIAVSSKDEFPIHSSVSGTIKLPCKKMISSGKVVECIGIFNDYKEKYLKEKIMTKNLSKYTREGFVRDLEVNGIVGFGSNIPTYIKYKDGNIRYLIVNGIECFPYVSCDKALIYNHGEEILEAMDDIMMIVGIKRGIIVLDKNNSACIKVLNKYIKTYPNISIYLNSNYYPSGWERNIIYDTLGLCYKNNPKERGIITNNVSTIYAIYEMIKYNRVITSRIITIGGYGCVKNINVNVKIGSLVTDVMNDMALYKKIKSPLLLVGDLCMGKSLPNDDVIITEDVKSIFVIPDTYLKSTSCIKCGKCIEVCPSKILPVVIMENIDRKERLKLLDVNKCISCGLCSYICPSKIEVLEYVKMALSKVDKK